MKPIVINIKPEHEFILGFLFPTYSILPEGSSMSRRFIAYKDVTSVAQRDALSVYYDDCVFISRQIYDEFWDEAKIKEKCIEFARTKLRNRKTKFEPSPESFVSDCVDYMYDVLSLDEESSINTLFESFGSASFYKEFFTLAETVPVAKIQAALNTFVSKILTVSESSSAFYKKKAQVYAQKIRNNLPKAVEDYLVSDKDIYGLSVCKFYATLFV